MTCITLFCGAFCGLFRVRSLFFFLVAILLVLLGLAGVPRGTGIAFVRRLWYTCVAVGGRLVVPGGRVPWSPSVIFGGSQNGVLRFFAGQ